MVALSPATARTLGYLSAEAADEKKGFVEVSGRRGQGVKADDLIDRFAGRGRADLARGPERRHARLPRGTQGQRGVHQAAGRDCRVVR